MYELNPITTEPVVPVVGQQKPFSERVAPPPNKIAEEVNPITGEVRTIITLGETGERYIPGYGLVLS